MDAHFSKILAPSSSAAHPASQVPFIAADKFEGRKNGYKFQRGSKGTGYYYDRVQVNNANLAQSTRKEEEVLVEATDHKKRKRDEDEDDEEDEKPTIEKMLEDAEANGVVQLDSFSLKQLLASFEKKISKNQMMRMKYSEEPSKFLDSELELHAEIQELFAVAASPELYPVLVQMGAVASILGCVTHENTDISIAAVSLLQEMTEVETINEEPEAALQFIKALRSNQGLELIVQNLARLDESNEQDSEGVQSSLAVIENLVEIDSDVSVDLCTNTTILKYLLEKCKGKQFDANKLYCSEILSILLQADERNLALLCNMKGTDGMDELLQSIAVYRKKEVTSADEQECVENLFLSLCTLLQTKENQNKFLACEGFELLMRCLKEEQYAAGCTIPAINYAIMKNKAACERLIDVGGMKYVFPLLTGGGVKKALKRKGTGEKRNLEESALSIVAQLITLLGQSAEKDYAARLLNKLTEREHEKLERCGELYAQYTRQLARTEEQIEETRRALEDSGDEEGLDEFEDDDNLYSLRLEGGLFNLQQVSLIIAYACIFDRTCLRKAELRLGSEGASLQDVLDTLRDLLLTLRSGSDDAEGDGDDSEAASSANNSDPEGAEYQRVLTQWSAALSTILEESYAHST